MKAKPPVTTHFVWSHLKDRLLVFFRSRVADERTAEDLRQETFIRIHKGLEKLDDSERLEAWVFGIARNLLTDHYRSRGRRGSEVSDNESPEISETPEHAEDQFSLSKEIASWLPGTIDALPEKYRVAVKMFELDSKSQQEIADELGLSLSGAKSRIQRGRKLIRERLEECCIFQRDHQGLPIDYEERDGSAESGCGCPSSEGCE